jgi:hypothetical protein
MRILQSAVWCLSQVDSVLTSNHHLMSCARSDCVHLQKEELYLMDVCCICRFTLSMLEIFVLRSVQESVFVRFFEEPDEESGPRYADLGLGAC